MNLNRCADDPAGNLVEPVDFLHGLFHRRDAEDAEKNMGKSLSRDHRDENGVKKLLNLPFFSFSASSASRW